MSTSNSQSWGNAPIGIFTVLVIVLLIWAFAGGRPFFRHTGQDIKDTVHDAGQDLKSSAQDLSTSVKHDVQ
jgi:hypothetical protein